MWGGPLAHTLTLATRNSGAGRGVLGIDEFKLNSNEFQWNFIEKSKLGLLQETEAKYCSGIVNVLWGGPGGAPPAAAAA